MRWLSSPQTENGFTRIANEILESVQRYKFTLNEMKIVMCVWRYTYGFQRKSHQLSLTFLMNHTGLGRTRINDSLKKLVESNVIVKIEQGGANATNSYMFNKNYNSWKIEKYTIFNSVQDDTSVQNDTSVRVDTDTSVQDDTSTSVQNDTSTSVQDDTQERKVKDNYKESIKDNNKGLPMVDEYFGEVIKFYEQNIGLISPYVSQQIGYLVDESNSELVLLALKKSVEANANNKFKYARAIVDSWKSQNFKTIEDVENDEKRKANSNPSRGNVHSLFDASPETLERQRRMVEEHQKNKKEIDYTDLPY
ncbi:hypothetical protein CSV75_04575 [Sporosarcina sp. P18a]|nr:hypothetical protein CSV75_04575 [Sporosarcina sp. P18a]